LKPSEDGNGLQRVHLINPDLQFRTKEGFWDKDDHFVLYLVHQLLNSLNSKVRKTFADTSYSEPGYWMVAFVEIQEPESSREGSV
jgi:hypothetical protein